jgi:hypothetical protein
MIKDPFCIPPFPSFPWRTRIPDKHPTHRRADHIHIARTIQSGDVDVTATPART